MKHLLPLFLFALGVTTASALATSFGAHGPPGTVGSHDFLVTLKPGQSYTLPIPATKYPGSPISIVFLDPGLAQIPSNSGSWIAKATVSIFNGSVSFTSEASSEGGFFCGTVPPGKSAVISSIQGVGTPVELESTSTGSAVSLILYAPASSGYPEQTYIVRVQGDN